MPRRKEPIIISYYTNNWEYPQRAEQLREDCKLLRLRNDIFELQDSGSWIDNTRLKSRFVHEKLEEHQRPVLWIDADSRILRTPHSISPHADFAGVRAVNNDEKTFYAGTLYFNYSDAGRDFARRWSECSVNGSDHMALEEVWKEGFDGVVHCLPYRYCEVESRAEASDQAVIVSGSSKSKSKEEYFRKNPHKRRVRRRRR